MIRKKNEKEIQILAIGGQKLAQIMQSLEKKLLPGINGEEINNRAEKMILKAGGFPSFKNYGEKNPFPSAICFSVNDEIVHGFPLENKILKTGDLIKIDIGMRYQGLYTDMARTFAVGKISTEAQKLLDVTWQCLEKGIEQLSPGRKLSAYSKVVQKTAQKFGFQAVRDLVGHGVGFAVHEDPQIPNYYWRNYPDLILKKGMVLALEPMINVGGFATILMPDGWTVKTKDKKLSAHFEDTVVITENSCRILTRIKE